MRVVKEFINRNRQFIFSLDKTSRVTLFLLLSIQFIFYLYYLVTVPLHYDEWHSLRYFSGNSFWTIISFYPSPNNHVFYNLISRVFILSGINDEVAVRLPSLFASLFTSYYFFKVCRNFFGFTLSLLLLAYIIGLYPFINYSFMARGYGFLNLFCVIGIYSALRLSEDYLQNRFRVIFIVSQFLGMCTVPSFLYATLPVFGLLGIFVLKQKRKEKIWRFIADCFTSVALVFAAYSIIFYNNDMKNMLDPKSGSDRFSLSDANAFENIFLYLHTRFFELFELKILTLTSVLVLAALVYYLVNMRHRSLFGLFLSVIMFFSPLIILIVHKVFPFGRNWLYMIFPVTLCFGFIIQAVMNNFKSFYNFPFIIRTRLYIFMLVVLWLIFQVSSFAAKNRNGNPWDYDLAFFRKKKLPSIASHIKEIGKTNTGAEFYPADVIYFFCEKANPGKEIHLRNIDENLKQDLLIIDGEELIKYRRKVVDYDFLYEHNNVWVYVKKLK